MFKGHVTVDAWHLVTGRRLWTRDTDNLVVLTSTVDIVNLIAGVTGYPITAVGFGSGVGSPSINDAGPLTAPAYYRAVDSAIPSIVTLPGKITVAWSLNSTPPLDYGATGMTVTDIGLFTNPTAAVLPASVSNPTLPTWAALTTYLLGDTIYDSNGSVQVVTTAGTSGAAAPSWSTTVGAMTVDATVTWTLSAKSTAPTRLFARALMPLGVISPSIGFTSTWILTA